MLDSVPTGRSVPTLGAMLPGARLALPDVGGTSGMQNRDLTVHGSDGRDTTFMVDGMILNGIEGDGCGPELLQRHDVRGSQLPDERASTPRPPPAASAPT